jgi:hypothetical protein
MKRILGLVTILGLVLAVASFSPADDKGQKPQPAKSYGSGAAAQPKPNPPPPPPPPPAPKSDAGSSGKSYGSGSKDPAPAPAPVAKPDATPGKTYGSGGTKGGWPGTNPIKPDPDVGTKPKTGTYDQKAGVAQQKQESKEKFQAASKGSAPAQSYTDSKGKVVQIDPKDKKIEQLRGQLSDEKWKNRDLRRENFYHQYSSRPVVVYHDPYNSYFWYWLLDRSVEQQAMWAYSHRYEMDAARYNDLLSRNAELRSRVMAMEAQGVARNTSYVPPGSPDPDLMYTDEYVHAAYNPSHTHNVDASGALGTLLTVFLVLGITALVVWLIFVKKWGY